jgi:hypothetical protein
MSRTSLCTGPEPGPSASANGRPVGDSTSSPEVNATAKAVGRYKVLASETVMRRTPTRVSASHQAFALHSARNRSSKASPYSQARHRNPYR